MSSVFHQSIILPLSVKVIAFQYDNEIKAVVVKVVFHKIRSEYFVNENKLYDRLTNE
jgi:hypothetical protein